MKEWLAIGVSIVLLLIGGSILVHEIFFVKERSMEVIAPVMGLLWGVFNYMSNQKEE